MNSPLTAHMLDRLKSVVAYGGPQPHEYPWVSDAFLYLYAEGVEPQQVAAVYTRTLRPRLHKAYDLIWSAGLFDYLSNYWFKTLATRYLPFVEPHGELVIGNFSPYNPTRAAMELLCQWYLEYRDAEKLHQLATSAGAADAAIRVEQEPQGVNLFLRICNEAHCCP